MKPEEWGQLKDDLSRISDAVDGQHGAAQQRIARVGLRWISTLLQKNSDYGCAVWQTPVLAPDCDPGTAIRVRMSDKISRIQALIGKDPEVKSESIEDTIGDLGAYCLLLLAMPNETTEGGDMTAVTKTTRLFAAANKIHARLIAIEACVTAIDKSSISRELRSVINDFDAALSRHREGGEG